MQNCYFKNKLSIQRKSYKWQLQDKPLFAYLFSDNLESKKQNFI